MSSYKPDSSASQPFRWHYAEFDDGEFQIRGRTLFFIAALFSAIILVALLFLYARWVCRFGPYPPPPPPPLASDSSAAARPPHAPPRGLDAATISNLPIVLHKSSVSGESECCICLGIFGDGDKVKVLPQCHHFFHSECVDKWLTTQSSCPLCRASLRVDSPV
ncbi:RING-H2 finger protein atl66 [Phtheirospermum japonicum]|uniref:RING-type E3 ubiquitin transferase n=1 Tax=Phtheirospermum japonicum TaxID=374723 RepID=A0A830DCY8_9LAMI|nr:RING-H2 finger protein atl66 [Phtheirospermum japonicum]